MNGFWRVFRELVIQSQSLLKIHILCVINFLHQTLKPLRVDYLYMSAVVHHKLKLLDLLAFYQRILIYFEIILQLLN